MLFLWLLRLLLLPLVSVNFVSAGQQKIKVGEQNSENTYTSTTTTTTNNNKNKGDQLQRFERSIGTAAIACDNLRPPNNSFFLGGYCSNLLHSACAIKCKPGYTLLGTSLRQCKVPPERPADDHTDATIGSALPRWTGEETRCQIVQCKEIALSRNALSNCTRSMTQFGTVCAFSCADGFLNTGSATRRCLSVGVWTGIGAKCKPIANWRPTVRTAEPLTLPTTTFNPRYYADFSARSISFGFSFKKIGLRVYVQNVPATFSIWLRTNYTKSIKLLRYHFGDCLRVLVSANENGSLFVNVTNVETAQHYLISRTLPEAQLARNRWTHLVLVQSETDLQLYVDGTPRFHLAQIWPDWTSTIQCHPFVVSTIALKPSNEFRIEDDLESSASDTYQPMRGEITRAYLYNALLAEQSILETHYTCERLYEHIYELAFDWSHVLVDNYLTEFKKKPSGFCRGCSEPALIKHALIYYEGTRNGDVLSYTCSENYYIVGYPTSVCTIHGVWSHKTPKCRRNATSQPERWRNRARTHWRRIV